MKLSDALRVQRGDVISFVGAGGKTSTLLTLVGELAPAGWRVLATTTTRIARHELDLVPHAIAYKGPRQILAVIDALNTYGYVFLYDRIKGDKAIGLSPEKVDQLVDRVNSDVMLIEADGSRQLPLKAPYDYEPVLAKSTTKVVASVGLDVLGQPLDEDHVYNAEAMIARFGYPAKAPVVWPWVASIMRDESLGLRSIPKDMPVSVLVNKVQSSGITFHRGRLLANLLLRSPRIQAVLLGNVQFTAAPIHEVRRPVGAVLLAAGLSSRMGRSKVLLPWGDVTVLEAIIRKLLVARVDEIVVVTGRQADQVAEIAQRYDATVVHNPAYASGEMTSSLQVGLSALSSTVDGALVTLGDQPQMQSYVASRVMDAYANGGGNIVIPSHLYRRGHPVLFGRQLWPALYDLSDGRSPRDLLKQLSHEIVYVNVNTETILQDIDTPEDYQAALRHAGLSGT